MMKAAQFVLALCLTLCIAACDENEPQPSNNALVGKWKLERITGGFSGGGYQADWNTLDIKNDLSYRRLQNDTQVFTSTYTLKTKEGKEYVSFKMTAGDPGKQTFESQEKEIKFEKGKLYLVEPCCDLFEYEFTKVGQ
jgi:hypothetical protein